jgi:SAM-dependent MidA family methyltransferase
MAVITYGYDLPANVKTLVAPASTSVQKVRVHNHEHNQNHDIFLGNADVTATNGMHLVATETTEMQLLPGDDLYAIATQNCNLRVLVIR